MLCWNLFELNVVCISVNELITFKTWHGARWDLPFPRSSSVAISRFMSLLTGHTKNWYYCDEMTDVYGSSFHHLMLQRNRHNSRSPSEETLTLRVLAKLAGRFSVPFPEDPKWRRVGATRCGVVVMLLIRNKAFENCQTNSRKGS